MQARQHQPERGSAGALFSLVRAAMRSVGAAARVAWGPQRVYVTLWALALFAVMFALRGGFTPSPPSQAWPWPVGTVHTGWTDEPYLFIVIHPRWLLTFQPFSMLRWVGLAGLVAWGAGVLRQPACCMPTGKQQQGWVPGVLGSALGVAGAAACCGTALPLLAGLAGLSTLSPVIDWLTVVGMVAVILVKGRTLAQRRQCPPELVRLPSPSVERMTKNPETGPA